jgi:hypothetical protein
MKKVAVLISLFSFLFVFSYAQMSEGDMQVIQKYFGTEKMALVKDYMKLTPKQDSVFWKDYNAYETERQLIMKNRFKLIDDYMKGAQNMTESTATDLVNKAAGTDIEFKQLQKTYFKKMAKTIGPVKAAQFYQFETYLNNVISLTVQEKIPFIGELEQKHNNKK